MEWIDIISYDGIKDEAAVAVRVILDQGKVRLEGDGPIIAELEAGIVLSPDGKVRVTPADGEKFLKAVRAQYRGTYLFASEVQKGEKIVEPDLKTMWKDVVKDDATTKKDQDDATETK
jgi:hypothetical protein